MATPLPLNLIEHPASTLRLAACNRPSAPLALLHLRAERSKLATNSHIPIGRLARRRSRGRMRTRPTGQINGLTGRHGSLRRADRPRQRCLLLERPFEQALSRVARAGLVLDAVEPVAVLVTMPGGLLAEPRQVFLPPTRTVQVTQIVFLHALARGLGGGTCLFISRTLISLALPRMTSRWPHEGLQLEDLRKVPLAVADEQLHIHERHYHTIMLPLIFAHLEHQITEGLFVALRHQLNIHQFLEPVVIGVQLLKSPSVSQRHPDLVKNTDLLHGARLEISPRLKHALFGLSGNRWIHLHFKEHFLGISGKLPVVCGMKSIQTKPNA